MFAVDGHISGKVFYAQWIDDLFDPGPNNEKRTLTLKDCRLKTTTGETYLGSILPGWLDQIEFDGSIIEGDLSCSFSYPFPLSFKNCSLEGSLSIYGSVGSSFSLKLERVRIARRLGVFGLNGADSVAVEMTETTVQGTTTLYMNKDRCRVELRDCRFGGEFHFSSLFAGAGNVTPTPNENGAALRVQAVIFEDLALIDECILDSLDWYWLPSPSLNSRAASTVNKGRVRFEDISVATFDLSHADFRGEVRIRRCKVGAMRLDGSVFADDLSLRSTKINDGLSITDTRFEKKLLLDWGSVEQNSDASRTFHTTETYFCTWPARAFDYDFRDRSRKPDPAVSDDWLNLRETWKASGNLEAANEADYRLQASVKGLGWRAWTAWYLGAYVWGFGYRPWRAALWLVGIVLGCAPAWWWHRRSSRANALETERQTSSGAPTELFQAAEFSLRTAWEWKFGLSHARGLFWKSFALAEQIVFKVVLLLFLKALASTSPLLKEITDTLLPFGT